MDDYIIYGLLGKSNFGKVYKGIQKNTDIRVAIKINTNNILVEREHCLYDFLWKQIIEKELTLLLIPRIYSYIIEGNKYILVIERLGVSLDKLYDRYNCSWSISTLNWILVKVLTLIKNIHIAGLIHRDIKPDNFAIGYDNQNELYIFDFGLSAKIYENGEHFKFNNGYSIIGTTRYASIYNHMGFKQSRRDDLESMWYMIYFLWTGSLPWIDLVEQHKILKIKKEYKWDDTTVDIEFKLFIKYIKNLKFDEEPNYDYWINKFQHKITCSPEWIMEIINIENVHKTKKNYCKNNNGTGLRFL